MMDTKFTPEPWTLNPLKNSDSVRIFAGNHYIGSIGNSDDEPSQTRANARLIAAAPDMYEAGKEMSDAVALLPCDDGRILGLLPILCRLRSALAKADGIE